MLFKVSNKHIILLPLLTSNRSSKFSFTTSKNRSTTFLISSDTLVNIMQKYFKKVESVSRAENIDMKLINTR